MSRSTEESRANARAYNAKCKAKRWDAIDVVLWVLAGFFLLASMVYCVTRYVRWQL